MRKHYQQGGSAPLQMTPWGSGSPPWERNGDTKLREVYEANAPLILENHREGPVTSTFNFPLRNDFTIPDVMRAAEEVYDRQQRAFRMNLEYGRHVLLRKGKRRDQVLSAGHRRHVKIRVDSASSHQVR